MKRYMNLAMLYAVLVIVRGVFYREYTKFNGFDAKPSWGLSIPIIFCWAWCFSCYCYCWKRVFPSPGSRPVGLNLTMVMFEMRGVTQVLETALSCRMSVTNSNIGGIGNILLGISLVLVLMQIKHNVSAAKVLFEVF